MTADANLKQQMRAKNSTTIHFLNNLYPYGHLLFLSMQAACHG